MARCERRRPRRDARGFAYLWMLMAVAFIGQGMVAMALLDDTMLRRDRERALLSIGRQFVTAIGRYHAAGSGHGLERYPPGLEALLDDRRAALRQRHLRRIFVDPVTGRAEWGLIMQGDRIIGVHSLAQAKPLKQAGFDSDMDFAGAASYQEWRFVYHSESLR